MTALLVLMLALQQTSAAAQPSAAPTTASPTQAPARRSTTAPTSTLRVHVTDRQGLALQGVQVTAEGLVSREGTSDAVGQVLLLTLPNGTYRLRASGDAFVTLEKEVVVRSGASTAAPVEMTLSSAPPPPPPPEPPAPSDTPAAPITPASAPAGELRVVSIADLAERSLSGREPIKRVPVGCSGLDDTQMIVLRETLKGSEDQGVDQMLYVVAGEATLTLGGRDQTISSGWFVLVPRGMSHTLTRRGRNPAILLVVSGGQPCSAK